MQLPSEFSHLGMLVERLTAAVSGDNHDAFDTFDSFGHPEVKGGVFLLALAFLLNGLLPEDGIDRPCALFLRNWLTVASRPSEAMAFGKLERFGQFEVGGAQ